MHKHCQALLIQTFNVKNIKADLSFANNYFFWKKKQMKKIAYI